jgi:hypothetical protein
MNMKGAVLVRPRPVMLLTLTLLLAWASSAHAVATFDTSASISVTPLVGSGTNVPVTGSNVAFDGVVVTPVPDAFVATIGRARPYFVGVQAIGGTGPPPSEASLGSGSAFLDFTIENPFDDTAILVLLEFSTFGSCTAKVDDPASEFATCRFDWDGGNGLSGGGGSGFTEPGRPLGTASVETTGRPDFVIPPGETLSVHLFVQISGQATAHAVAVPAPATGILLTIGLAGLSAWRWRGRRR